MPHAREINRPSAWLGTGVGLSSLAGLVCAAAAMWTHDSRPALAADPAPSRAVRPRTIPADLGNRYQAQMDAPPPGDPAAAMNSRDPATFGGHNAPTWADGSTRDAGRSQAYPARPAGAANSGGYAPVDYAGSPGNGLAPGSAAPLEPWPEDASRTGSAGRSGAGSAGSASAAPAFGADAGRGPGAESYVETNALQPSGNSGAEPQHRADADPPLALPPPRALSTGETSRGAMPSMATLIGSLGVVVALFLFAIWLLKLSMPKGANLLPREAVEVLGRTPLTGRLQAHLVRCGNKILLVSVTPTGAETLTEITDPIEVDRLAGICFQGKPQSATTSFRTLLGNFSYDSSAASRRRDRRPADDLDLSRLTGEA